MDEILAKAPCGFLTFDDDGKIMQANTTFAEMLGYAEGELPGMPFDKILPVSSRIFHQTHLFPLLKLNGTVNEIYLTIRTKTGENLPTLLNAVRHERGGALVNDCIFVQMKERGEYEDSILRAKKIAEEALHTKDQFLATVSHELRTPLHSMLGWLRVIEGGHLDPEIAGRGFKGLTNGLEALKNLIEDLIDFSRANAGRFKLSQEQVNVEDVIGAALETIRPAADAKSITLQFDQVDESASVLGDPGRMQQIIWNLLSNAIKFTPKGGSVGVRLGRVNSSVEVRVSDTGRGISSEFLPYVFDRFQQEHTASSGRGGGLGIGMAITRQLVELHGGTVRAESSGVGYGATFTVRLPVMVASRSTPLRAAAEFDPAAIAPLPRTVGLDGLKILILEDDAQARVMLTDLLEHAGATVASAGNLIDGLESFRATEPDAVVCDIELSDGDGYSFIQSVRDTEADRLSFTPAIALTALARPDERMKALKAGFHTYFTKPVEPIELIFAIANLTKRIKKAAA